MTKLPAAARVHAKAILIAVATAVLAALVIGQVDGVNGPGYWRWSWRRLDGRWLYPAMVAAALPFALGQWAYLRGRLRVALALLAVATLCLQLAALACQPPQGLRRLPQIVMHPDVTSYWMDASILHAQENIPTSQWLAQYPDLLPLLHRHAKYRPPGLLLYYLGLIKLLGVTPASATAGGLGIAVLAALAPLACFGMIRFFSYDQHAAFCGASFLSMCPSLVLFLPQFDQVYATLACVILTLWGGAGRNGRWLAAVGCGALLALALFMSYIFLVLGFFIVAHWMFIAADRGADRFWRATLMGMLALLTIGTLYVLLYALTGFEPIETFQSVAREQAKDLLPLVRPFPQHILFDVIDFALGSGWISYLLVSFFIVSARRRLLFDRSPRMRLALLALLQIAVVAAAALLPGETARLWLLLMPLLMVPVGLELSSWPAKQRMIVYACLGALLVLICQNMTFLYMGPELDGPR